MILRTAQEISDFFDGSHNPFMAFLWLEDKQKWEIHTNLEDQKQVHIVVTEIADKLGGGEVPSERVQVRPRTDA